MSQTYSFLDVKAAFAGPTGGFSLTGGVAEEGITFTARADKDDLVIGADGSGLHSRRADKSATVSVKLLKNSSTNALMSAMYNVQQENSALWGNNVITVALTSLGDTVVCTGVAFRKAPTVSYTDKGQLIDWEFNAITMTQVLAVTA